MHKRHFVDELFKKILWIIVYAGAAGNAFKVISYQLHDSMTSAQPPVVRHK
jgi:hypothetical protein